MAEGNEAVKAAKEFVNNSKADLVITDVPVQALTQFKELAMLEFSSKRGKGHYGFCLKFLLDFYLGRIVDGSAIAEAKAEEALAQVVELKGQITQPESEDKIKLCNGKEMRR